MTAALIELPPAMREYAWGTRGDDFLEWCAEHLIQSVDRFDGVALELEGWQARLMAEALSVREDGTPYWRSAVIVLPRKNGKTTLLAAYALYHLLNADGSPEVLLAASSDKQAGRLFDAVVAFVRQSPTLSAQVHIREWQGEVARVDGLGRILRVASSPKRLHGYNPSLVIADEVAQWTTPDLMAAWAALTTGSGARSRAQIFTISTAGAAHTRAEGILGRLIDGNEAAGSTEKDGALTISRHHEARTLVYNYSADTEDPFDFPAIRAANPATWITDEDLRNAAHSPGLLPSVFLQYHGCVWSQAEDTWLNVDDWRRLADPGRGLIPGEKITLGFDGSRVDDSTALVACAFTDPHIVVLAVWERPPGGAGYEWEVPGGEVDAAVAAAFDTYTVIRANFDPPLWQTEVTAWRQEFGATVHDWPTVTTKMANAVEQFRTDSLAARLTHADNPILNKHIANARLKRHRSGYWLEKPRLRGPDHIDAAVAAVLAYAARAEAIERREGTRSRVPMSWN